MIFKYIYIYTYLYIYIHEETFILGMLCDTISDIRYTVEILYGIYNY